MHGYVRVGSAVPKLSVGDCIYNAQEIKNIIKLANAEKVKAMVFPELCITGYTCGDLFLQLTLLKSAENALANILEDTKDVDMLIFLGMPILADGQIFNCGVATYKGNIKAVIPKIFLPNSNEFLEKRWFSSSNDLISTEIELCGQTVPIGADIIFECKNIEHLKIGVEICHDLWTAIPPSCYQSLYGANIIFNLSASNELAGKAQFRKNMILSHSSRLTTGYVYSSAGMYESSTDLVFGGHAIICENGTLLVESDRFLKKSSFVYGDIDINLLFSTNLNEKSTLADQLRLNQHRTFRKILVDIKNEDNYEIKREISRTPFLPIKGQNYEEECKNILNIQYVGLARRILHINSDKAVLAISGGLDSTLALLCTVEAYKFLGKDVKNIIGITMPGFGTTNTTHSNAQKLMESLGITCKEISIEEACIQHFKDIGHDVNNHNVAYENAQARERTQILMDIANMENGIAVGTGNLSESALGFSTYSGDHMSMYNVNGGVPKTLVKELLTFVSNSDMYSSDLRNVLKSIIDTPISPELLPPETTGEIKQKTEEVIGPYELNDFYLYHMLKSRFSPKKIIFIARHAFKEKYSKKELIDRLDFFYRRFFTQQFKRSCMPDGPKIVDVSLSPRGDFKMPSDASYEIWVKELENLRTLT